MPRRALTLLVAGIAVVAAALARPDAPNLDRGSHRAGHLDQIEQALADRPKAD